MEDKKKKIILAGGGTLGSVSPLLAISKQYNADYLFLCSENGPEKNIIKANDIQYISIKSGKLRRYLSLDNIKDIFKIKFAFFQSFKILLKFKPDIVLTSGSFVAVPVVLVAWSLRIPVIVHQQDLEIGLANRLMAPFAKKVTVTFEEQKKHFSKRKVILTGNPVRSLEAKKDYKPIIVITGGGLGARKMNDFLKPYIPLLLKKYEVHHILGNDNYDQRLELNNYISYKFIKKGMVELLSKADIVISRAGMSLITECASLKKSLILIPLPYTHQEKNAAFFAKHNAAAYVKQGSGQILERYLDKLIDSEELRKGLGNNLYNLFPKNSVQKYIKLINGIVK